MNLGKVVGTVVATQKEASMNGLKLLMVRYVDTQGKESGGQVVAADAVGAGEGEIVLIVQGSSARFTEDTKTLPIDCAIIGIVDNVRVAGGSIYENGK